MKIVATSLLCLCFLGSAIAAPTNDHGKDKDKKDKQHKVKEDKKPDDKPAANNGKHLGWYKNPHNKGNSTTASTGTTGNSRPGATTQSAPASVPSGPISKPGETTVWPGHPAPGSPTVSAPTGATGAPAPGTVDPKTLPTPKIGGSRAGAK